MPMEERKSSDQRGGLHRSTEAREAYKKSLQASKGDSKAGDLLEFWSERNKEEKLLHEPPKYLKEVCSKLQSPTVSSLVGTRSKFTSNSSTNGAQSQPRSRSTTPARVNQDNVTTVLDDSVDEDSGMWQSVNSADAPPDTFDHPLVDTVTTVPKRQNHNKYANIPSKLYQPTAASLHGQFKSSTASPATMTMNGGPSSKLSPREHKDEIPPHVNVKYAHVTSKLLAPTAATIAARKVINPPSRPTTNTFPLYHHLLALSHTRTLTHCHNLLSKTCFLGRPYHHLLFLGQVRLATDGQIPPTNTP